MFLKPVLFRFSYNLIIDKFLIINTFYYFSRFVSRFKTKYCIYCVLYNKVYFYIFLLACMFVCLFFYLCPCNVCIVN